VRRIRRTMAFRKLPRSVGCGWFDYDWSEKNPVVRI